MTAILHDALQFTPSARWARQAAEQGISIVDSQLLEVNLTPIPHHGQHYFSVALLHKGRRQNEVFTTSCLTEGFIQYCLIHGVEVV